MEALQRLQSDQVDERAAAAESLATLGEDARPAATALVKACQDDEAVSVWAVAALEQLGAPPKDQLDSLRPLVSSDNTLVAYWSITLLGRAGEAALAYQDELATALSEASDQSVRERAAWALGKIGARSPATTKALTAASGPEQPPRLARLADQALAQIAN